MTSENVLRNITAMLAFAKSPKPEWASPLDVAIVLVILSASSTDGKTNVSIEWLMQRTGAGRTAMDAAIKRLDKNGWLAKLSGKQNYMTNTYRVSINNLPMHGEVKHGIIGAAATNAAYYYHGLVKSLPKITTKNGRKRSVRVAKDWEQHWAYTAQCWIDDGFDADHIKDVIDRAFQLSQWSYCHGLQTLKRDFVTLLKKAGWNITRGGATLPDGCLLTVK
jgi:hypothetical protein